MLVKFGILFKLMAFRMYVRFLHCQRSNLETRGCFYLALHNEYLVNSVDTDGLFQKQQGTSSHIAKHA